MTTRRLAALLHNSAGVTVVEFALIAPALMVMVMGLFDLGYTMYVNSMLSGAIQKAARDSAMESGVTNRAAIDTKVSDAVKIVVHQATLTFDRKSYASFSDAGRPEDFTDVDGNGVCNNGEPFEDANGNHIWDSDRGLSGQGGARDAVLYTVTVQYSRPFPVASLIGMNPRQTLVARAILRNQPYGLQNVAVPVPENCP